MYVNRGNAFIHRSLWEFLFRFFVPSLPDGNFENENKSVPRVNRDRKTCRGGGGERTRIVSLRFFATVSPFFWENNTFRKSCARIPGGIKKKYIYIFDALRSIGRWFIEQTRLDSYARTNDEKRHAFDLQRNWNWKQAKIFRYFWNYLALEISPAFSCEI